MPQCAFKNCANTHRNTKIADGISFFRFPMDPYVYDEWVAIVSKERGEQFQPAKHSTLCSKHFNDSDIIGNKQRRRLLKTAIPKLLIFNTRTENQYFTKLITSNSSLNEDLKLESSFENTSEMDDGAAGSKPPRASETRCYPEKICLLTRKISNLRERLEIKSKLIQNLRRINNRLIKKVVSLKRKNLQQRKQSIDDVFLDLTKNVEIRKLFNALYSKNKEIK